MQRRAGLFPVKLITPSLIVVSALILLPLIQGVFVSLQIRDLMLPVPPRFAGLENYRNIFADDLFWMSLRNTIIWVLSSVSLSYVLGLLIALLLNLDLIGKTIFRSLLLLPWVVQNVVIALVWKWLLHDQYGYINQILNEFGVIDGNPQWLGDPFLATLAIIIVYVWKTYPFMTITLLAALQTIPKDLHEAAIIDGAGTLQRFRYITFPLIRSVSLVVTLLLSIWAFNHFDIIYVLTRGGPGNATMMVSVLVYFNAFFRMSLGYASALGVIMLVLLLIGGVLYLRMYKRMDY